MPDKVTSGDIIEPRAGLWNDMVDAANAHKRGRLGLARKPRPPKITPPDRVKVKNVSGGNLAAGSVVQLGTFLLTDRANGYLWFEADEPSSPGAVHAILRKALPNNDIGEAQLIGAVAALVNVNDVDHTCCLVKSSQSTLESSPIGPHRLVHAPGTGSQLCIVILGGGITMAHCICIKSGGIAPDQTGKVTIGGKEVVAENHTGLAIGNGDRGRAYIESGEVYVEPLECSEPESSMSESS